MQGQTPEGANSPVFRFTKQVWLNPTVILARQYLEQSTGVKLLILPRFQTADTSGDNRIEKAFDKVLSFLMAQEQSNRNIRFYFSPKNPGKPFSVAWSNELHCKFTPLQKDSVETILNASMANRQHLDQFSALPFDSAVTQAARYCQRVLLSKPGSCGPGPDQEFRLSKINSTPARIDFTKAPFSELPFNGGVDRQLYAGLAQHYTSVLDVADNSNYALAWKALAANHPDKLKIRLTKKQSGFDISRLAFKNADGTETYNASSLNPSDSSISFTINGRNPGSVAEVVAWYTPTVAPVQSYAIGAFNARFYEVKTYKLVLVNLGGANMPDVNMVRDTLKKIYGEVFVNWQVASVNCPLPASIDRNIPIESSGLLSNYMPAMQPILSYFREHCTAYQPSESDTYYLLFGATNDGNLNGYMPRARNTGFVFDTNPHTIAHELGHGAFNLKHVFCNEELGEGYRGTTDNLMDYGQGSRLYKHQWDQIHDPDFVGWFDGDDEEGALVGGGICNPAAVAPHLKTLVTQAKLCPNAFDTQFEAYRNQPQLLQQLCFDQRLEALLCLLQGYVDDEDQEGIIALIYTTPKAQLPALFNALKVNYATLLRSMYAAISGSEYNQLIDALAAKAMELHGMPPMNDALLISLMAQKKFVAFDQWKATRETYKANGNYSLTVRRNFRLCCEYELLSDPFSYVLVRFDEDFSINTAGRTDNYAAGSFLVVPAVFLAKLINEADSRTIRYSADVVGMYFGFTELKLALQGGRALALAILDIGISATDIALGVVLVDELNKTPGGQAVLNGWNSFAMCYGLGRGSAALYTSARNYYILAKAYRQKPGAVSQSQAAELDKSIQQAKEIIEENGAGSLVSADEEVAGLVRGNPVVKLTTKSSLSETLFNSLNNDLSSAPSIKFEYNPSLSQTPKQFLNESGANIYDILFADGVYVKMDLSNGRMLFIKQNYHAFVEYASGNNVSSMAQVEQLLVDRATKMKALLGYRGSISVRLLDKVGGPIQTNTNKVTTFIGKTTETKGLKDQFGNFKHIKVGETPGSVNLLNMPDPYWNPSTWFEDFNKDWMLRAINRGDDIYIASPIDNTALYNVGNTGKRYGSYFANELNELVKAGIKPKNISQMEWDSLILEITKAAALKNN